ncbi:MAG: hypothetical protein ACRCYU_01370 [Nocardioides sp.]
MDAKPDLSCPQCTIARDIYRYCMNCGHDFEPHLEGASEVRPRAKHRPKHAAYSLPPSAGSQSAESTSTGSVTRSPAIGQAKGPRITGVPAVISTSPPESPPSRATHRRAPVAPDTAEHPAIGGQPMAPPDQGGAERNRLVGGRSAPLGLGLIVGSICVLLLVAATMVSLLGDHNGPAASASGASSDTSADTNPAPSTLAVCWNDQLATAIRDCSPPARTAGLAWVFPSFDRADCADRTADRQAPERWSCPVRVSGGGATRIHYRQLKFANQARTYYDRRYGRRARVSVLSPREDVERYVWHSRRADNNGVWSVTSLYAAHPWSVTVIGRSSADVEAAFKYAVEFRNPRQILGRPAHQ